VAVVGELEAAGVPQHVRVVTPALATIRWCPAPDKALFFKKSLTTLQCQNYVTFLGKLHHGSRASKIWNDEDIERFLKTASAYLRLAMLLALNTRQRQGDLLRLPWSSYDGATIKLRQGKTGAYVPIPVAAELRDALDATPRRSPIILTNSEGKPWSESGFQGAWGKATARAGVRGLTFHDLPGTAVVTLARAGCTEVEIYSIIGHKPSDVQAILTTHYLPRDAEVASNAISKLNQHRHKRRTKNSRLRSRPRQKSGKLERLNLDEINWLGREAARQ